MSVTPATYTEEELVIECQFRYLTYPKSLDGNNEKTWMVAKYADENGTLFAACGYNLPLSTTLLVKLYGKWKAATEKYGQTFDVSYHEVILPDTEKGFVEYISTLKVGIGRVRAKAIYKAFGDKVWYVIENEPSKLLEIRGVTEKKLNRLKEKLVDTVIERQLAKLFSGTIEVSAKRIKSIKDCFGSENLIERISQNPYILFQLNGFSFKTVDKLGKKLGIEPDHPMRIRACADSVLANNISEGNVCMPKDQLASVLFQSCNDGFEDTVVTMKCLTEALNNFCHDRHLRYSAGMIYANRQYEEETGIVRELKRLLAYPAKSTNKSLDTFIADYEKAHEITLAASQKEAIRTVLTNSVSIITGGPGTGKSTIIRAVLWVSQKATGSEEDPVLMAPTGRAARRMRETTGYDASTIHHAIHFCGEEEMNMDMLEGNLYIIDESSMIDQYIGYSLLKKIPGGSRVVFVGDPNQLPSVGCGNFLSDLIASTMIPTTMLTEIFRQAEGNPIIDNADRIRRGITNLNLTHDSFVVFEEPSDEEVFKKACRLYLGSVEMYGIDNVILLNSYRSKSNLNVDLFNRVLQHKLNPIKKGEPTIKNGKCEFHKGDRVMQMKNTDIAKNGDVGMIQEIVVETDPDDPEITETIAKIEFNDDGILHDYNAEMIGQIDLAFCTTVHKSQGSEYSTVIMVVSKQHWKLNNRATIYTGITRASENLAIVTEQGTNGNNALTKAIKNNEMAMRYTMLAPRLRAALRQDE